MPPSQRGFSEELVWKQLRTIYDPEIPVNIVDLGLIYSCVALASATMAIGSTSR